jgi:hypothetical protein
MLISQMIIISSSTFIFSQIDSLPHADSCLNNILETKVLRKGIYRDLKEFQTNSPSYMVNFSDYEVETTTGFFITVSGKKLEIKDTLGNIIELTGPIWGFCDGKKVFKRGSSGFWEFSALGHYCIYEVNKYYAASSHYSPGYGGVGGSWHSTPATTSIKDYALNMITGEEIKINMRNLTEIILKDDPELLKKFNNEPLKDLMIDQYITKYNKRHPVSL